MKTFKYENYQKYGRCWICTVNVKIWFESKFSLATALLFSKILFLKVSLW